MKLNIAYPTNGTQKLISVERKVEQRLYDQKIGNTFEGSILGPEYNGYVFEITGGDDRQGFPMRRGVPSSARVRLLLKKGDKGYRCRRDGCRRRKSVRGEIVSSEISVLSVIIVQKGDTEIAGVTDRVESCSHLPKRASKLRERFEIPEGADIKKFLVESITKAAKESGQEKVKIPRIRITGEWTQEKEDAKNAIKKEAEERKKRSKTQREEFFAKYPELQQVKN
ncbi:ribosomal protein S6 [Hamiltosporidium tvaerminnensis]|uniref:40S ribosomal protein S6 n=1 Tax=Hamiltosporidium tvaerminnensis TaxID=1176355 RepID=A0A4V2JXA7_9MICR|nr:ribosomal protein S6 [Hamiltosporidium tvaerminnensis]